MKSKIKVTILYEPFGYPKMPYGIYELTNEVPTRELARTRTKEEALQIVRKEGWLY